MGILILITIWGFALLIFLISLLILKGFCYIEKKLSTPSGQTSKIFHKNLPVITAWISGILSAAYQIHFDIADSHFYMGTMGQIFSGLFMPLQAAICFAYGLLVGYWPGIILKSIAGRKTYSIFLLLVAIVVTAIASYYIIPEQVSYFVASNKVKVIQQSNNPESLMKIYSTLPHSLLDGYEMYVFAALAENSHASEELLDKIAHDNHLKMHDRLHNRFNIAQNRMSTYHGISAIRLLAENRSVSNKTIDFIVDSSNDVFLLGDIAEHQELFADTYRKLYKKSKIVDKYEAKRIIYNLENNPSTPRDILLDIKKSKA